MGRNSPQCNKTNLYTVHALNRRCLPCADEEDCMHADVRQLIAAQHEITVRCGEVR